MSKKITSIRGMNDILPTECTKWQMLEQSYRAVLEQFCYQEIRMPVLEETQLFKRSVGEVTDIVEKEMYTFPDRNDLSLTLRPEGTAGCVRAAEQHGLLYNQTQRLFYAGPMFRYERPQKGRARQFHQLGVEAFGISGSDIELELILLSASLFRKLGIYEHLSLETNSIGDSGARAEFGRALSDYLEKHKHELDKDSLKRLDTNPLRILDSKDEATQKLLANAPKLADFLSDASLARFDYFKKGLEALGISFVENPNLVRGLDYYNDLVFEWTSKDLGAQATVCAGGRYDSLVETLGGKATPAVGFAIGIERLILLLDSLDKSPVEPEQCDIFIAYYGEENALFALALSDAVRVSLPQQRVFMNCGGASLKSQLKKADKSGARFALIIGESELETETVQIKYLRERKEAATIHEKEIVQFLNNEL